ncbi:MAG: NUDIX domain-containing protein [Phaeodactylibacter sp.]|nr:NUDIX domain-containing protein [Phaeodactylibacter sp.]
MVVLRHEEEFLLLRRNKEPNAGRYVPIGGKLEPHERPIDAAIRETYEEARLQINKDQLRYAGVLAESSPTNYNWLCFIYVVDIGRVPPPPCDEGSLEWISFDKIPDIPTPPTDWQIYQYLMRRQPFALDAVYDEHLNMLEMREEIGGEVVWQKD